MLQHFSGFVEAPMQAERVEQVTARLINALKAQVPSAVIESSAPVRYRRPFLQTGFVGIASFGSGTIEVVLREPSLSVRYSLSLAPYYLQACNVILLLFFFAWKGLPVLYAELVGAVCEFFILGRLLYSMAAVRSWLNATIRPATSQD